MQPNTMGGCRCTYRDCLKATNNSENFHFFHYPIRDRERCLEWIKNAKKPNFIQLPQEQLRNKVVCQLHFEERFFTNESKRRLVHNAIPTLERFEPRTEVVTVEILQSNSNVNVYSLGRKDMINTPAPNCPTYFIHNGDVIPANHSPSPVAKVEVDTTTDSNPLMSGEMDFMSENDAESESVYWSQADNLSDPLNTSFTREDSTAAPSECEQGSVDIVKMSKIVDQHSRDIGRLNRTLKKHLFTNGIIRQFKKRNQLINQLRGLIPPSLHTIVALQLSTSRMHLSKHEKNFILSLYDNSPSTYKFLSENCHWKLPSSQYVEELLLTSNNN